jgi:hypothetical protein
VSLVLQDAPPGAGIAKEKENYGKQSSPRKAANQQARQHAAEAVHASTEQQAHAGQARREAEGPLIDYRQRWS